MLQIRHRKPFLTKMRHFRSPLSGPAKPKRDLTAPGEAPPLGFRHFSIATPTHPASLNNAILIPVATNRGAPGHNFWFANGSERDRRGFLSNQEYLSTILRLSRQMTAQNGPNIGISVPRDGFATTKPPPNQAPDARHATFGIRAPCHRCHEIPVPDKATTPPREKPPEATPTSRLRPFTHRIETEHTQQRITVKRARSKRGGVSISRIWKIFRCIPRAKST